MTSPVSGGFQFTPATGLNDTTAYPTTPANEAAARQQFMDLYWQLMNEMNAPTASAAGYALYNKLINGNFEIAQRGTSFTNPANTSYTSDRWRTLIVNAGVLPTSIIHSRQPLTAGDLLNSFYYYRVNVNGPGSGFTGTDGYLVDQPIEHGTRYLCGSGKKVTLSFYARSDIAGKKMGVRAVQGYGTGGSPSASEILVGNKFILTNTWTKYTVTFTTNTLVGKTFGSNNDDTLSIDFGYMWGPSRATDYSDTVTETFGGAGNIDIAQVQVNAGDQTFPFQPRSYSDEEFASLRYNYKITSTAVNMIYGVGVATSSTTAQIFIPFPRRMRVNPAFTQNGNFSLLSSVGGSLAVIGLSLDSAQSRLDGVVVNVTVSGGLTAGNATSLTAQNNASSILNFDAEI